MQLGKQIKYNNKVYRLYAEEYDPETGFTFRFKNDESGKELVFSEKAYKELKSNGEIK